MAEQFTIWSNAKFPPAETEMLRRGVGAHRLVLTERANVSNLVKGSADPALAEADIAFGQPDPEQAMNLPQLRWIHLNSAGYTNYDNDRFRAAMKKNGTIVTNSSWVYAEPCAQHVLAMMLGLARRLPQATENQIGLKGWPYLELRAESRLLCGTGQTVLIVGYGTIGARLVELLEPFRMILMAFRRQPRGDEEIATLPIGLLNDFLPQADHVVNILPASPATDLFFNNDRFARMKPSAIYYNIGRGVTNDQAALVRALEQEQISAAYLDVTTPEPLPKNDPLWTTKNCFITPHTGGGHSNEFARLVEHFLNNLRAFEARRPLEDRVI